jgi:2-polyprenyl-6-methoxyphenol hydroxylase-like FAD-dependent oxidoreductase
MPAAGLDTDILIVGAGPVGLFLANECARRNLRWRIIEAHPSQSLHSKALAIFPRTMEIFDMAGVIQPFLAAANQVTSVAVITHAHTLAQMPFKPEETPYPFVAMVPQNVTEKILAQELQRKGGTVDYETTFISARQENEYVEATLDHRGERTTVRAAFLVGCDGAHSAVRKSINIHLEGGEYADTFMLADIETNDALPADQLQLCPSELGPVAIFPMSATRRRVVATVKQQEGDAPSLELVRKVLAERAPAEIEARSLHWSSYFHIHHRHAAKLRAERIFIAGDAAHIHSPFGGQGMNTGLHDVWNLVWKLDLFLRHHGTEQLLESYSAERLPVIENVIATTDRLTKVMGTPNRFAQALRNTVIPMVSRLAPFQHAFVQRLSELGIAYADSPLVEGPGERYFDDSMRGGNGIRSRFLIFGNYDDEPTKAQAASQLSKSLGEVVELRPLQSPGLRLVRPDGYVAYTSQDGDPETAVVAMRSLLLKQAS